jgi:hypothetical protein
MAQRYIGDVELIVKMRYRVIGTEFPGNTDRPTKEQVLDALQGDNYDDIIDEEELAVLEVLDVGPNLRDQFEATADEEG